MEDVAGATYGLGWGKVQRQHSPGTGWPLAHGGDSRSSSFGSHGCPGRESGLGKFALTFSEEENGGRGEFGTPKD